MAQLEKGLMGLNPNPQSLSITNPKKKVPID